MQLFVNCPGCNGRYRLVSPATVRSQIPSVTLTCGSANCVYRGQQQVLWASAVYALPDALVKAGATVVLGLAGGLLAGPPGMLLGLGAGYVGGDKAKALDEAAARRFNESSTLGLPMWG